MNGSLKSESSLIEFFRSIMAGLGNLIALMIATTFFTGMITWIGGKKMRGKLAGTITSLAVSTILVLLYEEKLTNGIIFMTIMISFLIGTFSIQIAENFMLDKWSERKRHNGKIVSRDFNETTIDEAHGMLIAVLPIYLPYMGQVSYTPFIVFHLIALVAFRIFDIVKPWPVKSIEQKCDKMLSLDIMLDDTAAGIMAMIITFIATMIFSNYF